MVVQIIILGLILLVLPIPVGSIFAGVDEENRHIGFCWVCGQICLWAGFQAICVPNILRAGNNSFLRVIQMYSVFVLAMLLFSLAMQIRRYVAGKGRGRIGRKSGCRDEKQFCLWCLVGGLLVLQLVLAVVLAYDEGDDAFYVATSAITAESGTMYEILPYTGGSTGLDARHGLAPFPIWVAMLSKLSGMHSAAVAQIILPVTLILMAYVIYFMLGKRLLRDKPGALPLFMLFIEVLVMFGGQSLYTTENFLLVRTAQGKAVLACIVIPFLFMMLYVLFEKLQDEKKPGFTYWLLVAMTTAVGCLCSTQGALLTCILLGVGSACGMVCYRRWKLFLPAGICCAVPAGTALLYLMLG